MARIHNFSESLAWSHGQEDAPWWVDVYREAFEFPGLLAAVSCRQDGEHQRAGVDRILTLANGHVVYIDEKVRKESWPDFALEVYDDLDRKTPGWVRKPLRANYIAYAFRPTGECYLLPTITLQRAWRLNKANWWPWAKAKSKGYRFVDAFNQEGGRSWTTRSVAVPRAVLLGAVSDAMLVRFLVNQGEAD